jgi:sugar/nucleoside kinase (ribokinase family)
MTPKLQMRGAGAGREYRARPVPDVLTIGNAIVDVIAHADDAFLAAQGLVKGSMQLIDAARAESLYDAMGPGIETSGGSAANTAVGVASLGGTAAFVGKVRDDQLGDVFRHDLRAVGVGFDVPPAPASEAEPTGRSLILVTVDAQRTMNTHLGVAAHVCASDVAADLVAASAIVYAEGYLWDSPPGREAITTTLDLARDAGRQRALTLSDGFCVDRHRETFLGLLDERVDVLFANEDEITSLYEVPTFAEAIERFRGQGRLGFLTCGGRGSVVVSDDDVVAVEAETIDALVDTTGAGDMYAAGALFGLARGMDLEACARLGSVAAAEVITHIGPRPSVDLHALALEANVRGFSTL